MSNCYWGSVADRIRRRTKKQPNGCWIYSLAKGNNYGSIKINGIPYKAHRVAWRLYYGVWPTEDVLHHCDTPACINPGHLFEGTDKDNSQDAIGKGRLCTKLLPYEVEQIKSKIIQRIYSQRVLGEFFGVSQVTISNVQRGLIQSYEADLS